MQSPRQKLFSPPQKAPSTKPERDKNAPAPCGLKVLESPQLAGVFPGLKRPRGVFTVNPADFPCCGGSGWQTLAAGAARCDMTNRMHRLMHLQETFERLWRQELPHTLILEPETLATLAANASPQRGLALASDGPGPALPIWAAAFAAAWRFGRSCHVVMLGRTSPRDLRPAVFSDETTKPVIFVEGVGGLWNPEKLFELEALIGFAYQSAIPLWLGVTSVVQDEPPAAGAVSRVHRRVAALRSKPPLAWLSRDGLTKLRDVCQVARPFYLRKEPPRATTDLPLG